MPETKPHDTAPQISYMEDQDPARMSDWQNDETLDMTALMQQLAVIYTWANETFSALDLQSRGTVDLAQTGPQLFRLFSEMKIPHLWDSMAKALNGEVTVTLESFHAVFFLWMGIDEQFEMSCQRGAMKPLHMACGVLTTSPRCAHSSHSYSYDFVMTSWWELQCISFLDFSTYMLKVARYWFVVSPSLSEVYGMQHCWRTREQMWAVMAGLGA